MTVNRLVDIINAVLRLGHFSLAWRVVDVVMTPKPGKDRLLPRNHRRIS